MITIRQHNKNWRIKIEEEWGFENIEEMKQTLLELIEFKRVYGDLKEFGKL